MPVIDRIVDYRDQVYEVARRIGECVERGRRGQVLAVVAERPQPDFVVYAVAIAVAERDRQALVQAAGLQQDLLASERIEAEPELKGGGAVQVGRAGVR